MAENNFDTDRKRAIKLANMLATDAKVARNDLSKILIPTAAALLIFTVALSTLITSNLPDDQKSSLLVFRFAWLCYLLSICSGVCHQYFYMYRCRAHSSQLYKEGLRLHPAQDSKRIFQSDLTFQEKFFYKLQVSVFLIGLAVSGISLFYP